MKKNFFNKRRQKKGLTFLLSLLLLLLSATAFSQTMTVSGVITDQTGETMPGVNVQVKGTGTGVVADLNGAYRINVPNQNAVLVFSYIGYTSEEIPVGNRTTINVVLSEDSQLIEEVVVIGYGVVRKSDLTGSVASVSDKQFQDQPMARLDEAINGRVPGVIVTLNSGAPDQNITVRIRGANSIYGGNSPLYVVDGIPNTNLFNNLDANDIQSIEILKDASATAIYGSRGANGVVLVTTKRGSEGKARITFETQQSFSKINKKLDLLDPYNYALQINAMFGGNEYNDAELAAFKAGTAGTDWQDLIFQTSHSQTYRLNVSGGNNRTRYVVSGNYMDTQGILILSQMQRYGLRSNISADATDWLKLDLDINANRRHTSKNVRGGGIGNIFGDAYTTSPTMELKDADGNWLKDKYSSYQINPYGRHMQDLDDSWNNDLSANLKLTFKLPVKGLTFDVQGSTSYRSGTSFSMTSIANDLRQSASQSGVSNSRNDAFSWININQLNYSNQFGDHRINAIAVAEFTKSESGSLSASVHTLLTEGAGYWNFLGTANNPSNSYSGSSLASFIGRAFYSYKDRYLITGTIRQDGSSAFQSGNKWGTFPSLGLSWIASQEDFIKNLNVFDVLKVRATWGITGNQSIGSYATLGLLSGANDPWGTITNISGYRVGNPPAKNLTWEKTRQIDFGLDFGFFKNRLTATIDIYQKNTYDLLLRNPIPYYNGSGDELMNQGEIRNRGIDFALTAIIFQQKDLRWESMFNISYIKNEVLNLGIDTATGEPLQQLNTGGRTNQMDIDPAILKVGEPMGAMQGWTWLGLWRTDEAAEAAKWGQSPGDNHFKSFSGYTTSSGIIQRTNDDLRIIGKAFPDVTLGWNNTFTYKNFDVNLFLSGSFGHDRINLARWFLNEQHSDAKMITGREGWLNRWTPENQDTKVPNPFSATIQSSVTSHQYLESGDYVRIRNLSISYTIPRSLTKLVGDIRVTISGQNLYTFTKYTGLDPEVTMSTGSADTNAGVDGFNYPLPRTFTAGLRLMF